MNISPPIIEFVTPQNIMMLFVFLNRSLHNVYLCILQKIVGNIDVFVCVCKIRM